MDAKDMALLIVKFREEQGGHNTPKQHASDSKIIVQTLNDEEGPYNLSQMIKALCESPEYHTDGSDEIGWTEECREGVSKMFAEDTKVMKLAESFKRSSSAIEFLQSMFTAADADKSGTLETDELAKLVKEYYKHERVGRPLKVVQGEVARAMEEFDADKSGALDFKEFIRMVLHSQEFKFKLTDMDREMIEGQLKKLEEVK